MTASSSQVNYNSPNGMSQRSSFITLAEEIAAMNKNTVEITTKMSDIVTSQDSAVSISLTDLNGNTSDYYMPTVGYLKSEIDKVNTNIKRLAGIESTTNIIDGKTVKKVYTVDINREPYPIDEMGAIEKFETVNNHFLESLMSPLLTVDLDLSDKVTTDVNKIKARRYIVKFERNPDFSLTLDGKKSYDSFKSNFENRTDISIGEFETWYSEQSEIGILNDVVKYYDEQIFDISVNEVNSHGLFSIIKTETDTINKKLWYHVNTLNYYTKEGYDKTLVIGDYLILNRLNSASKWVIKEISKDSSNNRLSLKRVEGYDPLPIGTNVLSYYSDLSNQKNVKISVGFDEFCILFIKPINTESNVISTLWSKGTYFYTNDLVLETDNKTDLAEYYLKGVYDYGKILRDLVLKKIPTEYAETPGTVILDSDNFKVVQINAHLTDTESARVLKNLHSQKVSVKNELSQLNSAIIHATSQLYSTSDTTDRTEIQSALYKYIEQQDKKSKQLSSIVSQISANVSETNEESKFRLRGFWNIPAPVYNGKTTPQHVVQFRIQYRYSAKSGEINSTEGFKLKDSIGSEKSNDQGQVITEIYQIGYNTSTNSSSSSIGGTVVPLLAGNIKTSTISGGDEELSPDTTAYFSNWNEIISDVRKRYWDGENGYWYWKIEDVEDADTPNINQLNIPIRPNEKIEVRIKSISEVGWPDSKIESKWSDIMEIEFPDELDNVLNENEYILKQASQDEIYVNIESNLNSRGVFKHIQDSFYVNETYYAHLDKGIQSSFRDDNGNYINVYEYLNLLTNRIKTLEEQITNASGEFSAYLHTPDNVIKLESTNSYNVIVELEDYAEKSGITRSYFNRLGLIDDYYVEIKNSSLSTALPILSRRKYSNIIDNTYYQFTEHKALMVDYNNDAYTQFDNQYIWFSDNSGGEPIYSGITALHEIGQGQEDILSSSMYNLGWSGETSSDYYSPVFNMVDDISWTSSVTGDPELFTTVHPRVYNSSDLVETGVDKKKNIPGGTSEIIRIHIYYKLDGNSSDSSIYHVPVSSTPDIRYRKLKLFIEPETSTREFVAEINFKIKQYRQLLKAGSGVGGPSNDPAIIE